MERQDELAQQAHNPFIWGGVSATPEGLPSPPPVRGTLVPPFIRAGAAIHLEEEEGPALVRPVRVTLIVPCDTAPSSLLVAKYAATATPLREWLRDLLDCQQGPFYDALPAWRQGVDEAWRLFLLNARVRWRLKALVRARLQRLCATRLQDTDAVTLEQVPPQQAVDVYEYGTRALFRFHFLSFERALHASAMYASYGLAQPSAPRNPHTNLRLTPAQLHASWAQLCAHMGAAFTTPRALLVEYRACGFEPARLLHSRGAALHRHAASLYLADRGDAHARADFTDCVRELVQGHTPLPRSAAQWMPCVLKQALPVPLRRRWIALVADNYVYRNTLVWPGRAGGAEERHSELAQLLTDTLMAYSRGELVRQPPSTTAAARPPVRQQQQQQPPPPLVPAAFSAGARGGRGARAPAEEEDSDARPSRRRRYLVQEGNSSLAEAPVPVPAPVPVAPAPPAEAEAAASS